MIFFPPLHLSTKLGGTLCNCEKSLSAFNRSSFHFCVFARTRRGVKVELERARKITIFGVKIPGTRNLVFSVSRVVCAHISQDTPPGVIRWDFEKEGPKTGVYTSRTLRARNCTNLQKSAVFPRFLAKNCVQQGSGRRVHEMLLKS